MRSKKTITWLKRELTTLDSYALGYSDIASTYYFILGIVTLHAGPALPLVMAIASLPLTILALTYAEFGSAIPEPGGAYYYIKRELGSKIGFFAGWLFAYDQIIMISYGALCAISYLGTYITILNYKCIHVLASLLLITTLMIINILGLKISAKLHTALLFMDIAIVSTILVCGFCFTKLDLNLNPMMWSKTISFNNILWGLAYAFRGYVGLDVIVQSTGEMIRPAISIPVSTLLTATHVVITTVSISVLAMLTTPWQEIAESYGNPVVVVVKHLAFGEVLAILVSILACVVLVLAVNSGIINFSRILYAMSREGALPEKLAKIHGKYRTPHIAIILSALLGMIFTSTGSIEFIADAYGLASLTCYTLTMISLIVFRNREKELYRPFKIPLTLTIKNYKIPLIALLGLCTYIFGILLIILLKPLSLILLSTWCTVGLVVSKLLK